MYLTERTVTDVHPVSTGWVDTALAALPDGSLGAVVGRPLTPGPGLACALWPRPVDGAYELLGAARGPARGPARYAHLVAFDGPRDAAWVAAEELSNKRIAAAMAEFAGWVRVLRARGTDGGVLILTLAESAEAIEAAVQRVLTLPLLPEEEPALLTGPNRVGIYKLMHADLAALD